MKRIWISLLLLMVAVQSFVAVANLEGDHQMDAQHIQTEHSHDTDLFEGLSDSEHNLKDCHHCGHCQGSHTQWFASKKSTLTLSKLITTSRFFYTTHIDKSFVEELLRPPIA